MAWHCHNCASGALDHWTRCANCGVARSRSSRAAAPPIAQAEAYRQTDMSKDKNNTYAVWTEPFGDQLKPSGQLIMNCRIDPPGKAEPQEMKMLLERGWVRLRPGHFQREVIKDPVMIFRDGKDKPDFLRTT
jgi:hypothetical protein